MLQNVAADLLKYNEALEFRQSLRDRLNPFKIYLKYSYNVVRFLSFNGI